MSAISAMLSPTVILSEVRVNSLVHLFADETAHTISQSKRRRREMT